MTQKSSISKKDKFMVIFNIHSEAGNSRAEEGVYEELLGVFDGKGSVLSLNESNEGMKAIVSGVDQKVLADLKKIKSVKSVKKIQPKPRKLRKSSGK